MTVVDQANRRVGGAYMPIDICATIHTMQTIQTAMQKEITAMPKEIDELKEANKRKNTNFFVDTYSANNALPIVSPPMLCFALFARSPPVQLSPTPTREAPPNLSSSKRQNVA